MLKSLSPTTIIIFFLAIDLAKAGFPNQMSWVCSYIIPSQLPILVANTESLNLTIWDLGVGMDRLL